MFIAYRTLAAISMSSLLDDSANLLLRLVEYAIRNGQSEAYSGLLFGRCELWGFMEVQPTGCPLSTFSNRHF